MATSLECHSTTESKGLCSRGIPVWDHYPAAHEESITKALGSAEPRVLIPALILMFPCKHEVLPLQQSSCRWHSWKLSATPLQPPRCSHPAATIPLQPPRYSNPTAATLLQTPRCSHPAAATPPQPPHHSHPHHSHSAAATLQLTFPVLIWRETRIF